MIELKLAILSGLDPEMVLQAKYDLIEQLCRNVWLRFSISHHSTKESHMWRDMWSQIPTKHLVTASAPLMNSFVKKADASQRQMKIQTVS